VPPLSRQAKIELVEIIHHAIETETLADEIPPGVTETLAQLGTPGQLQEAEAEASGVAGGQKEAGLIVQTDLPGAVTVVSDDRPAGSQGLRQGTRQPLTQGQVYDQIHDPYQRRHLAGGYQAGEDEVRLQPGVADLAFDAAPQGPVSHQEELEPRHFAKQLRRDRQKVFVAFEPGDARDFAHDDVLGSDAEPRAEGGVVGGSEERSSGKPLRILVYCSGRPMPACRYWSRMASATTTK
jgi:hypothetical protein